MTTKDQVTTRRDGPLRVDLIDNAHKDWTKVLASIDGQGRRDKLMLADGWLSARQSLFVARSGDEVAGHLCFHVEPQRSHEPAQKASACVEARLDALDVRPGFNEQQVQKLLVSAAVARANLLKCYKLVGFDLDDD